MLKHNLYLPNGSQYKKELKKIPLTWHSLGENTAWISVLRATIWAAKKRVDLRAIKEHVEQSKSGTFRARLKKTAEDAGDRVVAPPEYTMSLRARVRNGVLVIATRQLLSTKLEN